MFRCRAPGGVEGGPGDERQGQSTVGQRSLRCGSRPAHRAEQSISIEYRACAYPVIMHLLSALHVHCLKWLPNVINAGDVNTRILYFSFRRSKVSQSGTTELAQENDHVLEL